MGQPVEGCGETAKCGRGETGKRRNGDAGIRGSQKAGCLDSATITTPLVSKWKNL